MRVLLQGLALILAGAVAQPLLAGTPSNPPAAAAPTHPAEVAFVDEGEKGSVYRKFPTGERLYTYDRDGPNRSVCNSGCAGPWPPVQAPADAVPVGQWSIVERLDGTRQWALNGKPVYLRFHDAPDNPTGDALDGVWRLVPHVPPATEKVARLRP